MSKLDPDKMWGKCLGLRIDSGGIPIQAVL